MNRCAVALGAAGLVAAGLTVAAPVTSAAPSCPPGYVVGTNSQTGFQLCIQMKPGAGVPSPSAPTTSAPRSGGNSTT